MNKKRFALSIILILSVLLSLSAPVFAVNATPEILGISTVAPGSSTKIDAFTADGTFYLVLPADAEPASLPLTISLNADTAVLTVTGAAASAEFLNGDALDLTALCGSDDFVLTITAKLGTKSCTQTLKLLPTAGVASLYLTSADPVNQGRSWVESSADKSNAATGTMRLTDTDGTVVYADALTQIKGRGNSTWSKEKKPYQIKLAEKTDLLQTGDKDNRAKTWLLLANCDDASLLRNKLVYDLAGAIGMEYNMQSRPVNLFYDGEYRGAYLLCEKVEIKSGRVDITSLEDEIEQANPDVTDYDALSVSTGVTANGATYTYCEGLTAPADITGGYLLEMDTAVRATAEVCYFRTTRNQYVVVKGPEYCDKTAMDYIASYYQDYEDAVYHEGVNPTTGKSLEEYVSVESLAQTYLINELSKNSDSYISSAYLYKDAGSSVMEMGPLWDYDLSFGYARSDYLPYCSQPEGYFVLRSNLIQALYQIGSFRQSVHDIYLTQISPVLQTICSGTAQTASGVSSIAGSRQTLSDAAYANGLLWGHSQAQWEAAVQALQSYIVKRDVWLSYSFSGWNKDSMQAINMCADVPAGAWYASYVHKAIQLGILSGTGFGIMQPLSTATRAQVAQVLYAMEGSEPVALSQIFKDVRTSAWYARPVTWAYREGLVNGTGNDCYAPESKVTRQDLVVILYRYYGSPDVNGSLAAFRDRTSVSGYARDAVIWAVSNKVLQGFKEDSTIRPRADVTRAELATFLVRCLETLPQPDNK